MTKGDRVTTKVVFHFGDGSLHEETTVFTQRGSFRLVSYHLVQKGPSFPRPVDVSIDRASGRCVVRATDKDGKEKTYDERLKIPPDVANGMVPMLLKNVRGDAASIELPMVLATPKPRLVKLVIGPAGEETFRTGGASHKAVRYQVHIDLGGVVEILADLAGKAPPDTTLWMERGEAPAFVKSEGPMAIDAPAVAHRARRAGVRREVASPTDADVLAIANTSPHFAATSFWNLGLPRSGSNAGSIFSQPGDRK